MGLLTDTIIVELRDSLDELEPFLDFVDLTIPEFLRADISYCKI